MFLAAALLGMLIVFGVSGDTAFAKGKPTAFSASATIESIDAGDVTAAGKSGRFIVKNRMVGGVADGDLEGAFAATFGTNVPIESQSGTIHGDLALAGDGAGTFTYTANLVAKSSLVAASAGTSFLGIGPSGEVTGRIAAIDIDGTMTFTSGTQGHGTVSGTLWVIVDAVNGHIIGGAFPVQTFFNVVTGTPGDVSGLSEIDMEGTWHQ
ncbi:MAG: hypothetical protein IIC30_02420 [Chloroflexi bacterium]|nr:hypothetical protein [Chloroflexota bacterium]